MEWLPIESAPKDGRPIWARRVYEGRIIAEGWAAWRTVAFCPLYDPLTNERFSAGGSAIGWMRTESDYRFPEPTHWQPKRPPS